MEKVQLNNLYQMDIYDNQDYFEFNKQVNDSCYEIISSHERNFVYDVDGAREYIENMNYNMYLNGLNARIYILKRENEPVSFAIYSNAKSPENWKLDLMFTNQELTAMGFATVLLRASSSDLKQKGAKNFYVALSKNNIPGLRLLESFEKVDGVAVKTAEVDQLRKFIFNILKMKVNMTKEQTDDMLF